MQEDYIRFTKPNTLGSTAKDPFYRFTFDLKTLEENPKMNQSFFESQDFKNPDLLKARKDVLEYYLNAKKRIEEDGSLHPIRSFRDHLIGKNSDYSATIEFVIPEIDGAEDAAVIFGESWDEAKDCIALELEHFKKNDLDTSDLFWINEEVLVPETFTVKYELDNQQP